MPNAQTMYKKNTFKTLQNSFALLFNVTVTKFAISQSEAKYNVLISYDIKSLISWSLSSKVMLPYDKLQRGFANK